MSMYNDLNVNFGGDIDHVYDAATRQLQQLGSTLVGV